MDVNEYYASCPPSYTDELMHYGVLGMKWGKRKARREAIKTTSKNIQSKASKSIKRRAAKYMVNKNMSEKEAITKAKKTAWRNTGLVAAGSLLAVYGAKKLKNNKVIDIKNNEQKGKEALERMMAETSKIKVSMEVANRDLGTHYIKTRGADKTRAAVNNVIRKKYNIVSDM